MAGCATSAYSSYYTTFGCDSFTNPGPCLCTNALSSSRVAHRISSCGWGINIPLPQIASATQLWREYCRTNAGVSIIKSETRLENFPAITQVTDYVSKCLTSGTDAYINTFGCSDYTVAPCLCGDPASSAKVWSYASDCASSNLFNADSISQIDSASLLFNSFCSANLASPASRTIVAPIKVTGTHLQRTSNPSLLHSPSYNPGKSS
jgi:hypothetical protein